VQYQVFARKYRPKTFDDVLGQDHVVRTLRNAITQNRLAHAYLFVGPRGTGKTSTSRIFAKALNCTGGPKVDFDPDEDVCVEIAEGRSLDVTEIDGASNNSVDDIRALRESVNYAPARGQFRIYYIDEVHMLSTSAFNALLKTLEEPPPHVKFIFATTEAHKILPTILSRCQRFDLRKIPAPLIAKHLQHISELEKVELEPLAAHAIAMGADGGMRDAQSMLDQLVAFCGNRITEQDVLDVFGLTSHHSIGALCGSILRGETAQALDHVCREAEEGRDLTRLLTDLIFHLRNLMVHQVDPQIAMRDLPPEAAALLSEQSSLIGREKILQLIDQFAETESSMKWALNKRLYLEVGIIRATQLLGEATLSDVILALRGALDQGGGFAAARPAVASAGREPQVDPQPVRGTSMSEAVRAAVGAAPRSAAAVPPAVEPVPERAMPRAVAAAPPAAEPKDSHEAEPVLPSPAVAPAAAVRTLDAALWADIQEALARRAPIQAGFAREGVFLSAQDRTMVLGFPESQAMAAQSLMRATAKSALEATAAEVAGGPVQFRTEIRADLTAQPLEPVQAAVAAPDTVIPSEEPKAVPAPSPSSEEITAAFMDDPFIREALRTFEATLLPPGRS
jgi:DNA polymerase-3 subunit gamma/tau